jgi:hypothetical protein
LSVVPCLQIFSPLWIMATTVMGLTAHHKVNPGVALLAWFCGAVVTSIVCFVIFLIGGAMLVGLGAMLAPPSQF